MTLLRTVFFPFIFVGLFTAGMTAIPSAAVAASGALAAKDSGQAINFSDPSLAQEATTTVEGTLRVAYAERFDFLGNPVSEMAYAVETNEGVTIPVELAEELPENVANGAITAQIVDSGQEEAQVSEASVQPQTEEAGVLGTAHRAYVVRVPKTGSMPSESAAADRIANNVLREWTDESGGAISSFTVADTATLSSSAPSAYSKSDLCRMDTSAMQGRNGLWEAGAAKFPGVDFSARSANHLIMLTSGDCTDGYYGIGIGTVGSNIDSGGLSALLWDSRYFDGTGVHEIGHNFGLGHANVGGIEYYDIYSVMGFGTSNGQAPALDSLFRDRLGIASGSEIARPAKGSSTTLNLTARGLGSGTRGIAIDDPDSDSTFWIDYRTSAGRDSGATFTRNPVYRVGGGNSGLKYAPGVVVYQASPDSSKPRAIDVLKRETGNYDATSLTEGQSFTSSSGWIRVTVLNMTNGVAQVKVDVQSALAASPPTVTGTARVGEVVEAQGESFSPEPTSLSYQWYWRGDKPISGATSKSFRITAGYGGERLRVRVTGDRSDYRATNTISGSSGTVGYGRFSATSPTISGEPRVGVRLRAKVGSFSPTPTSYRYQWYYGSRAIRGATKSTYVVSSGLQGKKLRVRVTGKRFGYYSKNTISGYTATIQPRGRFAATGPSISGTRQVGNTLQATPGSVSPEPSSYRYQWYWKGSKAIRGATSDKFKITAGYRGQQLRVRVTAVRSGFYSRNTISGNTSRIAAGKFDASPPTVSGDPLIGSTLRATVGSYSPRPAGYRFQWYAGSTAIRGATKSTYTITSRDRGEQLRVRVTGSRYGYASKNTISDYTPPVVG